MREDRRHWIIFDPTVISHSRSLFEREVEAMKFATRRAKQKKSKEISEKSISPMASFTELQEGTVNHTRFFIGALIEDNAWEGKLLYEGHLIDVTVQKFKRVADAASYVAMLQKLNADHIFGIPSGYMFDRLDGGDEMPGLVFLEPMKSLSSWMERRKQNMWRKHGRYCLGVGSDFQDLFGDVGKAMHILTRCGYTHGSLAEYGVMLISNNKVRLVNMDPASFEIRDHLKVQLIIKDLNDSKCLIEKAIDLDPRTLNYEVEPNDVDLFKLMYSYKRENVNNPTRFIEDVSRWIYRSFLFWSTDNVIDFVESIDNVIAVAENMKVFDKNKFLKGFDKWQQTMLSYCDPTMKQCLEYHDPKPSLYKEPYGVIHFLQNYKKHPNGVFLPMLRKKDSITGRRFKPITETIIRRHLRERKGTTFS